MRVLGYLGIFLCAFALLGAGCSGRQVLNIDSLVATPKGTPTEDEVLKAVLRAGIVTGWRMTPQQSGVLFAERNEGSHSANIYIHYSAQRYSISLMDSSMVDRQMSYSAPAPGGAALASAPRTVHRTYNRWVQELDKAIRAQLATLGL